MKISKLFHWLYAILMLLPFAFFVPSVFYYAFNDNATMQSVEVPKTETISVDFNQYFDTSVTVSPQTSSGVTLTTDGSYYTIDGTQNANAILFYLTTSETGTHLQGFNHKLLIRGLGDNSSIGWYIQTKASPNYTDTYSEQFYVDTIFEYPYDFLRLNLRYTYGVYQTFLTQYQIQLFDLTQMFGAGNEPTLQKFNQMFPNSYYPYNEGEFMQITYETGTTEQLVENTSIINYAWESIWDLPLFSWTKITFVSVPFAYLTGLFGIGANSTLNYAFGYFATISICWLVFDVIMYVPMLVHRWIDKARIE